MGGSDLKKLLYSILFGVVSFLLLTNAVDAQTYRRGLVKSAAYIYKNSIGGVANYLPSDLGRTPMTLYAPDTVQVLGEEGNYYLVKFIYSGFIYNGYVAKDTLTVIDYTVDENFKQELVNKGFPQDYAEKLAALHAIHPNWVFTPSFTGGVQGGMDFYTAVRGEASVIDRNLTDSANTTLRSTAPGSYANGVWKTFSGGSWYAASEQTIAYYLDPRNFMNETNFFMFENQGYNGNVNYRTMVEKALSGSFMDRPFQCLAGANACGEGTHYYVDTFLEAGVKNGVNPVHLASRVLKEQGSTGSFLSLGVGYNKQYVGYFNFFNINANAAPGLSQGDVVLNGLKYAESRGWNNQHISIVEGAALIGNNYVGRGQSTAYYQKFNTIAPTYYGNQYMQNIHAPYSEGYSTYTSYYRSFASLAEWDNATYEFLIPVYQNMPTATSLDANYNNDSTLKSLNIPECKFNLSFQSDAYEYECFTKKETQVLNVSAEATNGLAKVEYPSKVNLTGDETTITVKVIAVNGSTSLYTIRVHRIETDGYSPQEILNGIGIKVTDEYAYNIAAGSDVSNIITGIVNQYHFAEVSVTEANGTVITEGKVKTGQKITITNSGLTRTFTVVIYGDSSGDGAINIADLLVIQKHIVGAKALANEYMKAADLHRDNTVDIRDLLLMQKHVVGQYTISQE